MSLKKIILFVLLIAAIATGVCVAYHYIFAEHYVVEQIAVETNDLVFLSDGKPVKVVAIDNRVPKKLAKKSENEPGPKIEAKVWIE